MSEQDRFDEMAREMVVGWNMEEAAGYVPFPAEQRLAARIAALVRRTVEECCIAVCEHCRAGNKPKASRDYGAATPFVHLFQGYPPRACRAASIRAGERRP